MGFPFAGRAIRSEPDCNPLDYRRPGHRRDGRNAIGFAACAARCPGLRSREHGSWYFSAELPSAAAERRRARTHRLLVICLGRPR